MPLRMQRESQGLPASVQTMVVPDRGALPLSGVTVLLVEDSRFTSDALRLMCQRSGARMRRAETIGMAQAHLRTYRPDLVIIDLGLPDGNGEDLIAECAGRGLVVIAASGDPAGAALARRAGACAFWAKPLPSLAVFQRDVLSHLPSRFTVPSTDDGSPKADPMALLDDLRHALAVLEEPYSTGQRHYLAGFLRGLACTSGEATLGEIARALDQDGTSAAQIRARLSAFLGDQAVI